MPVELWHFNVKHAKIGWIFDQRFQRMVTVGINACFIPLRLQHDRNGCQDVAVIIDQSDYAVIGGRQGGFGYSHANRSKAGWQSRQSIGYGAMLSANDCRWNIMVDAFDPSQSLGYAHRDSSGGTNVRYSVFV